MTNRQEREGRSAAGLFAIMALIGAVALVVGPRLHDRYVIGLAMGCLPTGVLGLLGVGFASRLSASLGRRP
jgi:hypothetical protein